MPRGGTSAAPVRALVDDVFPLEGIRMCVPRRPRRTFNARPLVLLVEPDPARRRVLADGLGSIGCDVLVSTSAVSALEDARRVDLLVLNEVAVPDETLRTIRQRARRRPILTIGERPVSLTGLVRSLHELMRERAAAIAEF